nr:phage tail assembly protein [uncultured Mediterranean phage uvMED]BAR21591.1 phage tail assembly protein [uncultured Mediterranean phage uvMED]BAR21592.1 phage tail assembly protein [uncultured Mediterranean phage uvMED]
MLRKVKLYGELADFVGYKELDAVINSTADAIRFLVSNFPNLESHMADKHYQVLVDDYDIDETELHNPIGQSDISIVPVITGAGGGLGKTLLGVALIGFSLATGGGFGALKMLGGAGLTGTIAPIAFNLGVSLTLMGVSEMLFPLPKPQDFNNEEDPRISFSFSGVQNTSRAGTSHPIVYGEIVTGSVVISAGIDTNQVSA